LAVIHFGQYASQYASLLAFVTHKIYRLYKPVDTLVGQYNAYITNLDTLQSTSGAVLDSYIPDATGIIQLSNLVSYTVSALLQIATNARQERSFILEEDDTLFTLAKRLYGLREDDSTITELIDTNKFTMQELLIIPKGRTIKYYV